MKRNTLTLYAVGFALGILSNAAAFPAMAQSTGYVTGLTEIQAFETSSGKILDAFTPQSMSGSIAVSRNGSSLYSPSISNPDARFGTLVVLSASSGEVLSQIAGIFSKPIKTILDPTGTYAFVLCEGTPGYNSVTIVNLSKEEAVGYIYVKGGAPIDIAMTPNGKQLFVSTRALGLALRREALPGSLSPASQGPLYECTVVPGICVFDTDPFGIAASVSGTFGYLAVSGDGNSLYSWGQQGDPQSYLEIVNTTSLKTSKLAMPPGDYVFGLAVAASGNQSAILTTTGPPASLIFLLDGKTNTISGTLAPPPQTQFAFGSNIIAFSPDGSSLWTIGGCGDSCSLLIGQSVPSGNLISQTALGSADDALAVTF